jgi:hypothetical protein
MTLDNVDKLAALILQEGDALIARWRQQVKELPSAKNLDVPALNDHIPGLLDELVSALRAKSNQTIPEALVEGSPPAHGLQRLQEAFDLEEVVAEYNILRGCIHDLAESDGLTLQGECFHILNRVLDQGANIRHSTSARSAAPAGGLSRFCCARSANSTECHFTGNAGLGIDLPGTRRSR